jgi:NitT/TauT family transport system permease protein
LGFGIASRIGIAATIAMFPLIVNTFIGIKNTDSERILFLRSLSATRWQIFRKVQLPSALPLIFAGLDLAIVFAVIGAIVGEMVSGLHGLGSVIMQKNFTLDTGGIFAILLILGVIGTGLHSLMRWIKKKVVFWSEEYTVVGT